MRADEPQFQGHYPGQPIMPGVLLCETVLQAGAYLMATKMGVGADMKGAPVVSRMNNVKFKRMVKPGDQLEIHAEHERSMMGAHVMKGSIKCEGKMVCSLDFIVMLVEDPAAETAYEAVVSLATGEVGRWEALDGLQPAIMPEEYEEVERLIKADPDFRAALARRGIDELDLVCVDPIPAGDWGDHDFDGRRLCRAAAWLQPYPDGNQYARPIEGLLGLVDLQRGEVLGDGWLRDVEARGEVLHRRFAARQRLEDRPATGVRQCLEDLVFGRLRQLHGVFISRCL